MECLRKWLSSAKQFDHQICHVGISRSLRNLVFQLVFFDSNIKFSKPNDLNDLVPDLIKYLSSAKGDPTQYMEVLMKFYQRALLITGDQLNKAICPKSIVDNRAVSCNLIQKELNPTDIRTFTQQSHKHYKNAMMDCVGYSHVYDKLLPESCLHKFYDEM